MQTKEQEKIQKGDVDATLDVDGWQQNKAHRAVFEGDVERLRRLAAGAGAEELFSQTDAAGQTPHELHHRVSRHLGKSGNFHTDSVLDPEMNGASSFKRSQLGRGKSAFLGGRRIFNIFDALSLWE